APSSDGRSSPGEQTAAARSGRRASDTAPPADNPAPCQNARRVQPRSRRRDRCTTVPAVRRCGDEGAAVVGPALPQPASVDAGRGESHSVGFGCRRATHPCRSAGETTLVALTDHTAPRRLQYSPLGLRLRPLRQILRRPYWPLPTAAAARAL